MSRVNAAARGFPGIATPHETAVQSLSAEALELRAQVEAGSPIYRGGLFGTNAAAEGQYWAPELPTSPTYSSRYGIASFTEPNFVLGGTLRPGATFVTRPAPGLGVQPGGALEIVSDPGAVIIDFFHMLE